MRNPGLLVYAMAACAVVGVVQPARAGEPGDAFARQILERHNRERTHMNVAPMRWNVALASSAQSWADWLARSGRFEHAPEDRQHPQGENIWAGTPGYYSPADMVDAWIREKRYFRPGVFPDTSTTGRVEDVGHYTQIIWRDTLEVGCAKATGASEEILVCRYLNAGNYRGERPI